MPLAAKITELLIRLAPDAVEALEELVEHLLRSEDPTRDLKRALAAATAKLSYRELADLLIRSRRALRR